METSSPSSFSSPYLSLHSGERVAHKAVETLTHTYKHFMNHIHYPDIDIKSNFPDDELCEDYLPQMKAHLRSCITKMGNKTAEDELQLIFFGYNKVFGNRCLENTTNGVKDFSDVEIKDSGAQVYGSDTIASENRKLFFREISEAVKRVDGLIRTKVQGDTDITTVQASQKLESIRVAHHKCISFIDFKKIGENLVRHVNQVVEYASNLIRISPKRSLVISALTNFKEIIFVAVQCDEHGKFTFKRSLIVRKDWIDELSLFLCTKEIYLGFNIDEIMTLFDSYIVTALGRGSTSAVYRIMHDPNYQVMKVSRSKIGLQNEYEKITKMRQYLLNRSNDYVKFFPHCYWYNDYYAFYGIEFKRVDTINPKLIKDLWPFVKLLHANNIVHRDIRLPNIVTHDRLVGLIDYSSAHNPEGESLDDIPPGSLFAASPNVVRSYYDVRSGNYRCSFNDEVIALIFLTILYHPWNVKSEGGKIYIPDSAEAAQQYITTCIGRIDEWIPDTHKLRLNNHLRILKDQASTSAAHRELLFNESMEVLQFAYDNYYLDETTLEVNNRIESLVGEGTDPY